MYIHISHLYMALSYHVQQQVLGKAFEILESLSYIREIKKQRISRIYTLAETFVVYYTEKEMKFSLNSTDSLNGLAKGLIRYSSRV